MSAISGGIGADALKGAWEQQAQALELFNVASPPGNSSGGGKASSEQIAAATGKGSKLNITV